MRSVENYFDSFRAVFGFCIDDKCPLFAKFADLENDINRRIERGNIRRDDIERNLLGGKIFASIFEF